MELQLQHQSFQRVFRGFPGDASGENPYAIAGDAKHVGLIPGWEDPLKKVMATHSRIVWHAHVFPYSFVQTPAQPTTSILSPWHALQQHCFDMNLKVL